MFDPNNASGAADALTPPGPGEYEVPEVPEAPGLPQLRALLKLPKCDVPDCLICKGPATTTPTPTPAEVGVRPPEPTALEIAERVVRDGCSRGGDRARGRRSRTSVSSAAGRSASAR
jgi:hypothetical protein